MTGAAKLDEIPYDFVRKRLSVLLRDAGEPTPRLICKGALDNVLQVSAFVQQGDAVLPLTAERREALAARFAARSAAGYRVLGLARAPWKASAVPSMMSRRWSSLVSCCSSTHPSPVCARAGRAARAGRGGEDHQRR